MPMNGTSESMPPCRVAPFPCRLAAPRPSKLATSSLCHESCPAGHACRSWTSCAWALVPAHRSWPESCRGAQAPRWRYWDVDERLEPSDEGGLELAEIEDSARLTALVQRGFDTVLRHFRISFDDHSTYDVICRWIRIEYEPRRRN